MLTPNGQSADKTDKIMLLAMWAKTLRKEKGLQDPSLAKMKKLISAGMGKPTYPVSLEIITLLINYWKRIENLAKEAKQNLTNVKEGAAIDYGDPRGDDESRAIMAEAMSAWYDSDIQPEHVLFTVGGAGALRVIFETLNTRYKETPGYRVITPFPHYSLYSDNPSHRLHPINVMKEPGYKLTAKAIEASINEAYRLAEIDKGLPKAILICNPNNPLGTVIDAEELKKIAEVLRRYPDLHIVLDEAYAEMCYVEMPSLLKIAPDLKERIIIMRSATKALSAAGERMAAILGFDPTLMGEMLDKNISFTGHAPRSLQMAYAKTMLSLDESERKKLTTFYKKKVDYVAKRLQAMGAAMPDPSHNVEATFYALGDFKDLFGLELPKESKRALEKEGKVSTDEELAYYLLFKDAVMIAPLSYFGLPREGGLMRITCSGDEQELQELMDRLENRLFEARKNKKLALLDSITQKLPELEKVDPGVYKETIKKIALTVDGKDTCLNLKAQNQILGELQSTVRATLQRSTETGIVKAVITLQSFFRRHMAREEKKRIEENMDEEWAKFVDSMFSEPCLMKNLLLNTPIEDRLKFAPWQDHLKNTASSNHEKGPKPPQVGSQ